MAPKSRAPKVPPVTPPPGVHVSNHPVLLHKLTLLRDINTTTRDFRHLLKEVTLYLGYEATGEVALKPRTVQSAHGPFEGTKMSEKIAIVPILRGGLGMVDALTEILPNAPVYHIGMFRNRKSTMPIQYYNRLPKDKVSDVTFVLDPLIATSGTCSATVGLLKRWGTKKIVVIGVVGSIPGLQKLLQTHPDVKVHVAAIDSIVNDDGYIVPGIGDAGERLFNLFEPHETEETDEESLAMSKRSKSS